MKIEQESLFLVFPETTIVEALEKMELNRKGILFVINDKKKLLGSVSNGDIRRWIVKNREIKAAVEFVMNQTPKIITDEECVKINKYKYMTKYNLEELPVVNSSGTLVDIIFKDSLNAKNNALSDVTVVIMAGGRGARLEPFTKILPKPLIPIGDVPIMERIIDSFREFGVKEFYATVNYRKNMIKSYFSEVQKKIDMYYVDETRPLGTAGSLSLIEEKFDKPFIVTNCDILLHADYEDIYKYHLKEGNELTIITALKNMVVPYGIIEPGENERVVSLEEKPKFSYYINTGVYILNPELIKEVPEDRIFHMTDLINNLLEQKRKVGMYSIREDAFLDMGEFDEMHRMEEKLNVK